MVVSSDKLLLLFPTILLMQPLVCSGCPQQACDFAHTSRLTLNLNISGTPSVLWTSPPRNASLDDPLSCISDPTASLVTCVQRAGEGAILAFGSDSGDVLWEKQNILGATASHPVVFQGFLGTPEIVAFDGESLVGLNEAGGLLGAPVVFELPLSGSSLSPSTTANEVILLCSTGSSLLVGYLTNGVIHGSITLMDESGIEYFPRSAPVLLENRAYLLAVEHAGRASRLFALDVARTMDRRLTIAWTFDLTNAAAVAGEGEVPLVLDAGLLWLPGIAGTLLAIADMGDRGATAFSGVDLGSSRVDQLLLLSEDAGIILAVDRSIGQVIPVRTASGEPLAAVHFPGRVLSAAVDRDTLIALIYTSSSENGEGRGELTCLDFSNTGGGEALWSLTLPAGSLGSGRSASQIVSVARSGGMVALAFAVESGALLCVG